MGCRSVLCLAILSIALMGSTCEFRASTGTPVPPPTPTPNPNPDASAGSGSGLNLIVRTAALQVAGDAGDTHAILPTTIGSLGSTSVLTSPAYGSQGSTDSAPTRFAAPAVPASPIVAARPPAPAGAVPEPQAFELYGLGLVGLAIARFIFRPGRARE